MPTYTELTELVGDQVLDALKFVDETTTSLVGTVNDTVSKLLPDLPSIPGASSAPNVSEVVAANFALAERFLKAQQKFALDLVGAASSKAD
jgi:hypothetical protein